MQRTASNQPGKKALNFVKSEASIFPKEDFVSFVMSGKFTRSLRIQKEIERADKTEALIQSNLKEIMAARQPIGARLN